MDSKRLSLQFAIGVAVASMSFFAAAIAFGFGTARPRLRYYSLLSIAAGGYALCEIGLSLVDTDAQVPWLSRMELFFAAIGFPGWFGYLGPERGSYLGATPSEATATDEHGGSPSGRLGERIFRTLMFSAAALGALAPIPGVYYTSHVVVVGIPHLNTTFRDTEPTALGQAMYAFLLLTLLLGIYRLFRAARAGMVGAAAQFTGSILVLIGGANDSLLISGYVRSVFLLPSAFGFAMATCGVAIVQGFLEEMRKVDRLTHRLERHVAERTAELETVRATMRRSERLAAIGTLSAGVAHEVNNPLAAIAGNLGFVIEEVEAGHSSRELLPVLRDTSELVGRIGRIVRQLLTAGRAAGGAPSVHAVPLAAIVKAAVDGITPELRGNSTLRVEVAADTFVRGDETHLTQILANLLANALHAVEGAPVAEVAVVIDDAPEEEQTETALGGRPRAPNGRVRIRVSDTGVGMSDDVRTHLFEPFFTTKPRGKGTGLGLAITHELVVSLGGVISVESAVGHGTTFTILLDRAPVSSRARGRVPTFRHLLPNLSARETPLPSTDRLPDVPRYATPTNGVAKINASQVLERRLRLLVIDDEPALRQSIRRMLAPIFDVVLEDDPLRGLAKICEGDEPPFDAVLCDVVMPNGGGEALYRAVAAFDGRRAARIVFMTGGAPDEKTRNFLANQPQPVLEKPFRRAETIAVLRAVAPPSEESASVVGP